MPQSAAELISQRRNTLIALTNKENSAESLSHETDKSIEWSYREEDLSYMSTTTEPIEFVTKTKPSRHILVDISEDKSYKIRREKEYEEDLEFPELKRYFYFTYYC